MEGKPCKILIVYYSMYGHVHKMAETVKQGVSKVPNVEVKLMRVPETLSQEVLDKMHAPEKPADIPVATIDDLTQADGILFGFPTRFGMMAAQMKAFFDQTGGLWTKGSLIGKPAGIFYSTGTQNGGQETTALTAVTQLTHHGMVFVPIGYSSPLLMNIDEIKGGSPYGAGTLAGPTGTRMPSKIELSLAEHQGEHFAKFVRTLCNGKH